MTTLFLIHGAFAGGWCWERMIPLFEARGFACVAPDLPHHGQPAGAEPEPALVGAGLPLYREALEQELAKLDGEDIVLVGHSLGGLLALQLAERGHGRAAVLLQPAAPWGLPASSEHEVAAAMGLLSAGPFWEMSFNSVFEIAADNAMNRLAPAEQSAVFGRLSSESGRLFFETMLWHLDLERNSAVDPARVTQPLLFVAGEDDRVRPPVAVEKTAALFPQADYRVWPGRAHWILWEPGCEEVAGDIADWIAAQN